MQETEEKKIIVNKEERRKI